MLENTEKEPQKEVKNWKKPSWRGVIRFHVVDILSNGNGYTLTEIQAQLQRRDCMIDRVVLYRLIAEMKGTFENLILNETKVRRYRNKDVPAFYITHNKHR